MMVWNEKEVDEDGEGFEIWNKKIFSIISLFNISKIYLWCIVGGKDWHLLCLWTDVTDDLSIVWTVCDGVEFVEQPCCLSTDQEVTVMNPAALPSGFGDFSLSRTRSESKFIDESVTWLKWGKVLITLRFILHLQQGDPPGLQTHYQVWFWSWSAALVNLVHKSWPAQNIWMMD